MKPKPFVLITALIYIGIAASSIAFAHEAFMSRFDMYSNPQCENYIVVENTGNHPIYAEPQVIIKNPYNGVRNITYTFRMCTLEDGKCATPFTKSVSISPQGTYQHTYRLNMNVNFNKYGDYHYTVSSDITGDVEEHAEKTCGIHVRKNN